MDDFLSSRCQKKRFKRENYTLNLCQNNGVWGNSWPSKHSDLSIIARRIRAKWRKMEQIFWPKKCENRVEV